MTIFSKSPNPHIHNQINESILISKPRLSYQTLRPRPLSFRLPSTPGILSGSLRFVTNPFCSSLRLTFLACCLGVPTLPRERLCTLAVFFQPTDTKATLTDRLCRIYHIYILTIIHTYLTSLIYMPVASLFSRAHHSLLVNLNCNPRRRTNGGRADMPASFTISGRSGIAPCRRGSLRRPIGRVDKL